MIISFDILMEPNAYSGNKYEIIIFKSSLGTKRGERFLSFSLFFFLHSTACGGQIEVGTLKHEVV